MSKCEAATAADFVRLMDVDGDGMLSRAEFRNLARNPKTQEMFDEEAAAAAAAEAAIAEEEEKQRLKEESTPQSSKQLASMAQIVDRPEQSLNFPVRIEEFRISDLLGGKAVTYEQMVQEYKTNGYPMNKRQLEEHWKMLKLEVRYYDFLFFPETRSI